MSRLDDLNAPAWWLPTWEDWTRYVLRCAIGIGLLTLGMALGSFTTANLALSAYQREIDAREATKACAALVDDAVRLTLDATLLARSMAPRAEPRRTYTVEAEPLDPSGVGVLWYIYPKG